MSQSPRKFLAALTAFFKQRNMQSRVAQHQQASLNGLSQLGRTPLNTLMTCLVIGIALALPSTLFVLLKNIESLSQSYEQSNQITLFLKQSTSENEALTLLQVVKTNPAVQAAHAISPAQGLQELKQQSGLDEVMPDLTSNPLPWAIVVSPKASYHSPQELTGLSQTFKQNPEVQSVQMDVVWAQRLAAFDSLAHRFIYALAFFLAAGVLLIINNCIRSVTQHNKKEINVIQFVGGDDAFVRRPFLYAGMTYGLLGGIIAWQLVDLLLLWLNEPASTLAGLYQSEFQLLGMGFSSTLLLLFSSITLGWVGAWFAVNRHLHSGHL